MKFSGGFEVIQAAQDIELEPELLANLTGQVHNHTLEPLAVSARLPGLALRPVQLGADHAVDALQLVDHIEPVVSHILGPFQAHVPRQVQVEGLHPFRHGGLADAEVVGGLALVIATLDQELMEHLVIDPASGLSDHS